MSSNDPYSTDTHALCDICKKEMTADTGCRSYWYNDVMVTVCNDCYFTKLEE